MTLLRHLLSILLLPFMVVVALPGWLLNRFAAADTRWPATLLAWLPRLGGIALAVAGLALFTWCVWLFVRVGRGTLAPWDPTKAMVAVGPYRIVRNPMITGVALLLAGGALFRGSWLVGAWAVLFVAINHVYFVLSEEPGLEKRFGENYRAYRAKVPRWLPRWRR